MIGVDIACQSTKQFLVIILSNTLTGQENYTIGSKLFSCPASKATCQDDRTSGVSVLCL